MAKHWGHDDDNGNDGNDNFVVVFDDDNGNGEHRGHEDGNDDNYVHRDGTLDSHAISPSGGDVLGVN